MKVKTLWVIPVLLMTITLSANAQLAVNESSSETTLENRAFIPATFPGGQEAMVSFIQEHLKYPQEAYDLGIEGKVRVVFTVMPDGSIANPSIKKSLGYGCDEEVIRVVSQMPKWNPKLLNFKPTRARMELNVVFDLY